MKKCEYLMGRGDVTNYDTHTLPLGEELHRPCLRSDRHEGPHLIRLIGREYIIWKFDSCAPGTCTGCDSEDSTNWCVAYGEVTSALELQKYIDDPWYKGDV